MRAQRAARRAGSRRSRSIWASATASRSTHVEPAEGWRAFVRGAGGRARRRRRASCAERDLEISGTVPARRRAVVVGRARGGARARAARARGGAGARPAGAGAALLADRERLGRRADRPARPDRLAVRRARPGAADRLPLARGAPGGARARRLPAGHARLGRAPHARRLGLQRAARRVRARRASCSASTSLREADARDVECACPRRSTRRVRHVVTENARVDEAVAALASGEMARARAGCSTPRTRACATDYEVSTPAVEETVARLQATRARSGRGSSAAASAVTCSACCRRTSSITTGAVEVRPGPGARCRGRDAGGRARADGRVAPTRWSRWRAADAAVGAGAGGAGGDGAERGGGRRAGRRRGAGLRHLDRVRLAGARADPGRRRERSCSARWSARTRPGWDRRSSARSCGR